MNNFNITENGEEIAAQTIENFDLAQFNEFAAAISFYKQIIERCNRYRNESLQSEKISLEARQENKILHKEIEKAKKDIEILNGKYAQVLKELNSIRVKYHDVLALNTKLMEKG